MRKLAELMVFLQVMAMLPLKTSEKYIFWGVSRANKMPEVTMIQSLEDPAVRSQYLPFTLTICKNKSETLVSF
jgi:hypothetical protein